MIELVQRKTDQVVLAAGLVLAAAAVAVAVEFPHLQPWPFAFMAAAAVLAASAVSGKVAFWIWLWVLSLGVFDRWFWMLELPGFFNLSIPRILFVAIVGVFLLHFLLRREPVRLNTPVLLAMLLMLAYVAVNSTVTGWVGRAATHRSAPYFRFFAGLLFPFLAFFFMYNSARHERQIKWALVALTLFGFYDLWIAYCQGLTLLGAGNLRGLIWPAYINSQAEGLIHFDRARGPFAAAGPQSVLLVFLFYTDLFLIRRLRGPYRLALAAQALLVLPALVFTGIRAGYVAFAVCGLIWCAWGLRGRFGWAKLSIAVLTVVLIVIAHWGYVAGTERLRGGLAQRKPVYTRALLARQSASMAARSPLFGVGFGHFVEAQQGLRQDPGTVALYGSGAMVSHNILLNLLAETGLVGLGIYAALIVLLIRGSRRLYRSLPPQAQGCLAPAFVALFWVMLGNYLASGMFRDMLWDPFSNALLWALGGLAMGFGRTAARGEALAAQVGAGST